MYIYDFKVVWNKFEFVEVVYFVLWVVFFLLDIIYLDFLVWICVGIDVMIFEYFFCWENS